MTVTTMRLVTPFGVGLQLCAQVVAHPQHRVVQFGLAGRDLTGTGGQQQHGVVGGAAAVDVEPVEGQRGRFPQGMVQRGGVGDGIGGDDGEHGGQRRRQHARTLGHAADGPVVTVVQRNLFRHGVGGHDGAGGLLAAGQPARHLVHDLGDARQHLVHRQPVADQPGRADRDLDGPGFGAPVGQRGGDGLGGGVGVLEPLRAGAGVGATGVEDHGAQPSGGQHLLRPQHRRGLDLVAGEHARGAVVGSLVEHQRQVERAGCLDAGCDSGGAEAGGRGDALCAHQPSRCRHLSLRLRVTAPLPRSTVLRSPASPAQGSSTARPRRRCP